MDDASNQFEIRDDLHPAGEGLVRALQPTPAERAHLDGQILLVHTPGPDSSSRQALNRLASWVTPAPEAPRPQATVRSASRGVRSSQGADAAVSRPC